MKSRVSPWEH